MKHLRDVIVLKMYLNLTKTKLKSVSKKFWKSKCAYIIQILKYYQGSHCVNYLMCLFKIFSS